MFVIKVVPQCEMIVKKLLTDKGYKVLCPRKIKTEGKYKKEVERIIFRGYLFIDKELISDRDYYKIKDTVDVIGFLDSRYCLSNEDEEYIRILNNNDKAIEKIQIYFDDNNRAVVISKNSVFNSKNVVRINRRSKTITFRVDIFSEIKDISFHYDEIAQVK